MRRVLQGEEWKDAQRRFARYQAHARANPTPAEAKVRDALDSVNVRYTFQKGFLRQRTIRMADFYLCTPVLICLEVDGGYHEKQADYDRYRERQILEQRSKRMQFLRVKNEWVLVQKNLGRSLLRKIKGALESRAQSADLIAWMEQH